MLVFLFGISILGFLWLGVGDYICGKYSRKYEELDCLSYETRNAERKKLKESPLGKATEIFSSGDNAVSIFMIFIGVVIGMILFAMLIMWSPMIDEKIVLYQEENTKIEEQIASVISDYQEYELGIIKECAPDKAVTMISLYPELKSDTLVAKQVDVYLENNNKIKQLKEEQINQKVIGWWFNFNLW